MQDMSPGEQLQAFAVWLRTGRRPTVGEDGVERKFNPYHDPRNGRFTFAPGGPRSLSRVVIARRRLPYLKPEEAAASPLRLDDPEATSSEAANERRKQGSTLPGRARPQFIESGVEQAKQAVAVLRERVSSLPQGFASLEEAVPSLKDAAAGVLLAVPDAVFDKTRLIGDAAENLATAIIDEMKAYVPASVAARLDLAALVPDPVEKLRDVRIARAAAAIRYKGDLAPMQAETLRLMQDLADAAYDQGKKLIRVGNLKVRISEALTIGNYVDAEVRKGLRQRFRLQGIDAAGAGPVRVNRRELETSGDERHFRRPDARIGDIAFDVTLTKKTLKTPQVRGFFRSDFRPRLVVIIRPRQLNEGGSYIITSPEQRP